MGPVLDKETPPAKTPLEMSLKREVPAGTRFGRFVVLAEGPRKGKWKGRSLRCICDCGEVREPRLGNLINGTSTSCGCSKVTMVDDVPAMDHPLYWSWNQMKQRCINRNHKHFSNYGGRGVSVCSRWINSFSSFVKDMGPRGEGLTLDRIDNDGDYEPINCRWATRGEQARNTRRNHWITHEGERLTITDWADRLGISYVTIIQRLNRGWPESKAVTTPSKR